MNKKLFIPMSVLVGISTSLLSACSSSRADNITTGVSQESSQQAISNEIITLKLGWWGNQTRNDATQKVAELYMSQNPNVKIELEFADWSGYWDKLAAEAAGGNLPDIMQMDYQYLLQYVSSNQLTDLTEFISNKTLDLSKIEENIIQSGMVDDRCYAVSLGSNAPAMVYNKQIVEQAGVTIPEKMTYKEFIEIGNEIYEKTGIKTVFNADVQSMATTARAHGSYLFDEIAADNKISILETLRIFDEFSQAPCAIEPDIFAEKSVENIETKPITDETTWNDFPFAIQYIALSNATGRELGITAPPVPETSTTESMYIKPAMFFSIAETSKHKEEAAKFIDWFINDVECNKIINAERGVPINPDIVEALKETADPLSTVVFEYVEAQSKIAEPIDPPDPLGRPEIETECKTLVDSIRYKEMTPEEAVDVFLPIAKKILSEAAK